MRLTNANTKAVKRACLKFHYAKCVPAVQYAYNVYNDMDEWCGVICYGGGAAYNIGSPYGLMQGEILELERVALNGKQQSTSECVAASLRMLQSQNPVVKMVVSYADLDQGHMGTIYQATNWLYMGVCGEGRLSAYIINGKKVHPRSVGAKGVRQSISDVRSKLDKDAEEFRTLGKHKYLYPYRKSLRRKLMKDAVPYPKK